ncbi:MAG TPA: hypothetical protein VM784_07515 [Actinomycetota bacterium]|jgi:Ca2+-binding RTX toxin-like protein|nr:hypothetical protein [Actinomycetota bacterium]
MKRSIGLALGMLMVGGALLQRASADHLQGCARDDRGDYIVHTGTSQQNHCLGQDGPDQDYIYGLGSADELGGRQGYDVLKGATGDDRLTDGQGSDDYDGTCHGDGADYSNVYDGDHKDDVYISGENDGDQDRYDKNVYDDVIVVYGSCPIADPVGSPPNPD